MPHAHISTRTSILSTFLREPDISWSYACEKGFINLMAPVMVSIEFALQELSASVSGRVRSAASTSGHHRLECSDCRRAHARGPRCRGNSESAQSHSGQGFRFNTADTV